MNQAGWRKRKGPEVRSAAKLGILMAVGLAAMQISTPRLTALVEGPPSDFQYAGGTEKLREHCRGKLEVTPATLVFSCPDGSITVPYDSIVVMQYRSDISRPVRRMKLKWNFLPWRLGGKTNRYLTIVYKEDGRKHALVLDVPPEAMRPYLAEIDLKSGRRVEVQDHEKYDY